MLAKSFFYLALVSLAKLPIRFVNAQSPHYLYLGFPKIALSGIFRAISELVFIISPQDYYHFEYQRVGPRGEKG